MDAIFDTYLAALRRRRRAAPTIKSNQLILSTLDQWLADKGIAATQLDPLSCEHYFDQRLATHEVSTLRLHLSVVRSAYRYAIRHHLLDHDPTIDVTLPRLPDREPATYSNDDLRAIYAAIRSEREQLIFFLFAFAGLRQCEAADLAGQQIDFAHDQIKLTGKGGKLRLVPLHPALKHVLQSHAPRGRDNSDSLITSNRNSRLSDRAWSAATRTLVARAGVRTHAPAHTFRKTVATVMHENGVRTAVIDKIMGWAPRTVRDRHYIRIAPQVMHDAIRTLYRDDPICPQQHAGARTRRADREARGWLVGEHERLSKLEHELGLRAS